MLNRNNQMKALMSEQLRKILYNKKNTKELQQAIHNNYETVIINGLVYKVDIL